MPSRRDGTRVNTTKGICAICRKKSCSRATVPKSCRVNLSYNDKDVIKLCSFGRVYIDIRAQMSNIGLKQARAIGTRIHLRKFS